MSAAGGGGQTVELTKAYLVDMMKEVLGPEIAAIREENEAKGKELMTSHMGAFFAGLDERRKAQEAPPEKGRAFVRTLQVLAIAKGDKDKALKIAKERYKDDEATIKFLSDGEETPGGVVVKALGSNVFVSGGALTRPGETSEVIELLRPASVVRSLNPATVPLDSGTLPIPKITGGATASYAGENQARNASEGTFGDVTLAAKELGCIVPLSNKLIAIASVDVDNLVRTDAIAAIGQREDLAFLQGDGTENTPRGMRYWAAAGNVDGTSYANTLTGITDGVKAALKKLLGQNVRMLRPAWIFHPDHIVRLKTIQDTNGNYVFRDEMAAGSFWGYPFRGSTQQPQAQFMFADMADVVLGQMSNITIDASGVAAYNDSSGAVVAAFSRNQTVIRLIENHDLGCRHAESIFVATNATWN